MYSVCVGQACLDSCCHSVVAVVAGLWSVLSVTTRAVSSRVRVDLAGHAVPSRTSASVRYERVAGTLAATFVRNTF